MVAGNEEPGTNFRRQARHAFVNGHRGKSLERQAVSGLAGGDRFELAFRISDEERLESALEDFDPELFVLAAPDEEGDDKLERVLDLLPDVPAGKLAIAELPGSGREDVAELERAGVDAVIVGGAPPTL